MKADQKQARTKDRKQESGKNRQRAPKPHPIEWITGGLSAALVVAMIGFTLYQAVSADRPDPLLDVIVEQVEEVGGRFHVRFRAVNNGDSTAAGVAVTGELRSGDRVVETRQVTLDYVPAHSEQGGGFFFDNDPGGYELRLSAEAYQVP